MSYAALPNDNGRDSFGTVQPPQWWLKQILSGHIEMQNAPQAIQSWARFPIHQGAVEIVKMDTVDERRAALEKIPPPIRPYVQAEVKRIWGWRGRLG